MADNVQITQGSGTTVATDDVSGVHYQRVKLVDGTLDSTTAIPGGTNGLLVQGQVAHDGAAAGNPLGVGGRANATRPGTLVADADTTHLWASRSGGLVVGHGRTSRTTLSFRTNLQSLASSSTVGEVSDEVDISGDLPADVLIEGFFSRGSGTLTGVVELYALASLDGTNYSGDVPGYSGTQGSYTLTLAGSPNLALLGVVRPNSADTIHRGVFSLKAALGFVPPFFAVVVVNNCGIALSSSGQGAAYSLVW